MMLPMLSMTIDAYSPWFAVAVFVGVGGFFFGLAWIIRFILRKLFKKMGIDPDRPVGNYVPATAPGAPLPPHEMRYWTRAAEGITTVAVGGWIELGAKLEPYAMRVLGGTNSRANAGMVDLVWNEWAVIAGGIVKLLGLVWCLPLSVAAGVKKFLVAATIAEAAFLVGRWYGCSAMMASRGASADTGRESLAAWNGSLGIALDYGAAILFLLFVRKLVAGWDDPFVRSHEKSGLRFASVLIVLALVQGVFNTPAPYAVLDKIPAPDGGKGVVMLVLGLLIGASLLRLAWLFTFGKLLWGYAKSLRRAMTPTPVA